jgi:hypothetical protein
VEKLLMRARKKKFMVKSDVSKAYYNLGVRVKTEGIVYNGFGIRVGGKKVRIKGTPFGGSWVPMVWQKLMELLAEGLTTADCEVLCYADDIIVAGDDEQEVERIYKLFVQRLKWAGFEVSEEKTKRTGEDMTVLGVEVSKNGWANVKLEIPQFGNKLELQKASGKCWAPIKSSGARLLQQAFGRLMKLGNQRNWSREVCSKIRRFSEALRLTLKRESVNCKVRWFIGRDNIGWTDASHQSAGALVTNSQGELLMVEANLWSAYEYELPIVSKESYALGRLLEVGEEYNVIEYRVDSKPLYRSCAGGIANSNLMKLMRLAANSRKVSWVKSEDNKADWPSRWLAEWIEKAIGFRSEGISKSGKKEIKLV